MTYKLPSPSAMNPWLELQVLAFAASLDAYQEDLEERHSYSLEQTVARAYHDQLCSKRSTDGCSWSLETWSTADGERRFYLERAKSYLNG